MTLWSVDVTHLTTVRPSDCLRTCLGVSGGAVVVAAGGSLRIVISGAPRGLDRW